MLAVNSDYVVHGTLGFLNGQFLQIGFAEPGWYLTDTDSILLARRDEENQWSAYVWNCPINQTIHQPVPTRLDARDRSIPWSPFGSSRSSDPMTPEALLSVAAVHGFKGLRLGWNERPGCTVLVVDVTQRAEDGTLYQLHVWDGTQPREVRLNLAILVAGDTHRSY